jgi:hypothetical protein
MSQQSINSLPPTPTKQTSPLTLKRASSAPATSERIVSECVAAPNSGVWTDSPIALVTSDNNGEGPAPIHVRNSTNIHFQDSHQFRMNTPLSSSHTTMPFVVVVSHPSPLTSLHSPLTPYITAASTLTEASDTQDTVGGNATPSSHRKSPTKTPRSGKIGRPKAEEAEGPLPQNEWEALKAFKKAEILALSPHKDGSPHEVFECEYQIIGGCRTLQFDLNDSRTCVSDYFGRNKAATAKIKRPIRWCRKHYQRASFQKDTWQMNKLVLILEQLDRIEEDDAGTTYTIGIKRSELQRLSDYNNAGKKHAVSLHDLCPGEAPFSILQHIFDNYKGTNRTIEECKSLIKWVRGEREAGRIGNIPQFEMVPEWPIEENDERMLDAAADEDDDDDDDGEEEYGDDEDDGADSPPSPTPTPKRRRISHTPASRTPMRKSLTRTSTPTSSRVSHVSKAGAVKKP